MKLKRRVKFLTKVVLELIREVDKLKNQGNVGTFQSVTQSVESPLWKRDVGGSSPSTLTISDVKKVPSDFTRML